MNKLFYFIAFSLVFSACVDREFDEPPSVGLSDLEANTTISELKLLHRTGQIIEITDDIIIEGNVISDDTEGNFYKVLVIQDGTAGIELRVNQTNLQAIYPRGRKVFVKCQGLSIGDYNNYVQLGLGNDGQGGLGRIPETVFTDYIEKGPQESEPEPIKVLISNIQDEHIGQLVELQQVEFIKGDNGKPYFDPSSTFSGFNRNLEDCLGGEMLVRTSQFADFANALTPEGNGVLRGVLTVFRTDFQMMMRDTDDADMPDAPCTRNSGNLERMNIGDIRSLYNSGVNTIPDLKKIEGIVISDNSAENIVSLNIAVQDESGGIVVRFTGSGSHGFQMNDRIEVEVSGRSLDEFQGLLQIEGVPFGDASFITADVSPAPRKITIQGLLDDFENLESSLVEIEDVEILGGGSFSGNKDMVDATGQMTLYTRSAAQFSGNRVPQGKVKIVGIVTQGGQSETMQISMRNEDDISGGTVGSGDETGGPVNSLTEDFGSQANNVDVSLSGWLNVKSTGERVWQGKEFQGNLYAQATAFNDQSSSMEAWLITPKLNCDVINSVQFETAQAFWVHDGLTVLISEDFDGKADNIQSATWNDLGARIAMQSDTEHAWIDSGVIDLSSFDGIVHIAFKYEGSGSGQTTSYRIDNIQID